MPEYVRYAKTVVYPNQEDIPAIISVSKNEVPFDIREALEQGALFVQVAYPTHLDVFTAMY